MQVKKTGWAAYNIEGGCEVSKQIARLATQKPPEPSTRAGEG